MPDDVGAEIARLLAADDIEGVVALIRRGAERGAKISLLRPSWNDLGQQLLQFRATIHQVVLEPATDPLSPLVLRPAAADSPQGRGATGRATARLDPAHALVETQMLTSVGVISDQLYGLAVLMMAEPPIRPAFVIGRVLLDAAATLHFLLDPAIPSAARAVRAGNMRLNALHDELRDYDGDSDSEGAERVRTAIDELLTLAAEDGITLVPRRRGSPERILDPRLPPLPSMAALLLGDLGRGVWRTLSSTVHAQDRPVLDLATGRGDYATSVNGRSVAALQLGASVLMTTEAVLRVATFRGLEADSITRNADELNVMWASASGMNDDEYGRQVDESSRAKRSGI